MWGVSLTHVSCYWWQFQGRTLQVTWVMSFVIIPHFNSEWKQQHLGAARLEQSNLFRSQTWTFPSSGNWVTSWTQLLVVRFLIVLMEMDSATHVKGKHTGGEVIPLERLVWWTVGHWWQNRNDVFISPSLPLLNISEWPVVGLLAALTLNLSVRGEGICRCGFWSCS